VPKQTNGWKASIGIEDMKDKDIHQIVKILKQEVVRWEVPIVTEVSRNRRDPFAILVSTLLSLRTKDQTTRRAATRLLARAGTPEDLLKLTEVEIQGLIYPVGFYKRKAVVLREVARELLSRFAGQVPDDLDELLRLKGVGRKTANLVVTLGFEKLGICVDTHVHRISNRLGYVSTRTPEQTEFALRKKLPRKYWILFNDLLVTYGQNLCKPVSPLCTRCRIETYCDQIGVTRHR
jgi:endonuclease-3